MVGVCFRKVSANGRCLSVYGRCLLSKRVCQWEVPQCLLEVSAYGRCLPMRGVSMFMRAVCLREVSFYRKCPRTGCPFMGSLYIWKASTGGGTTVVNL